MASILPLAGDSSAARFQVQGRAITKNARTYFNNVGPRYFETTGIRLLRRRELQPTDRVGLGASYFPARRATRIDPLTALRGE